MKPLIHTGLAIVLGLVAYSCGGDYRHRAVGDFGEVVVVMDSTEWNSATAEAIRDTYGQAIRTLPNVEALFDLRFRDFNSTEQLEQLKKFKNIIIAAPVDDSSNVSKLIQAMLEDQVEQSVKAGESFAFPLQDLWYRDQWVMVLTSSSDSALAQKIRSSEETLTSRLMDKELDRWTYEIYDNGEQVELADSLWDNHGWRMRIQHDWVKNIDTTYVAEGDTNHFITMRRVLPENDRWFWIWWKEGVTDISFLDDQWINAKRDSLMKKWIRGTREQSYVTTEYRRPVETESFEHNGNLAYETLGTWRMTNDAMGGPFANLTVYDDETNRLFIMEYGQFAPRYEKRRFVRQFRAMLRTFESDSTWSDSGQPQTAAAVQQP
jgi:hypothetical protein